MKCEKCGQEIQSEASLDGEVRTAPEAETVVCSRCGETVMKLGPYCYHCGRALSKGEEDEEGTNAAGEADRDETIDFSSRILCSDGACIGVINEQGACKVCGKPYSPES